MSNTEIGVIGQKYENRKTKKSGVLVRREYNNNILVFTDNTNTEFTVGAGTFKSNWRKVVEIVEAKEVEKEPEKIISVATDTPEEFVVTNPTNETEYQETFTYEVDWNNCEYLINSVDEADSDDDVYTGTKEEIQSLIEHLMWIKSRGFAIKPFKCIVKEDNE